MLKRNLYTAISKIGFGLIYYDDIMQHVLDRDDVLSRGARQFCMTSAAIRRVGNIYEQASTIFVHIPKNAGTSISSYIYNARLPHMTLSCSRYYFPKQISGKKTFAIYRDPFDRFLSAYYFCRQGGTESAPLSSVTRGRVSELKSIDDYLFYVKNVDSILELDHVFRPQYWYLAGQDSICEVDYLFDMGDVDLLAGKMFPHMKGSLPVLNVGQKGDIELTRWQRSQIEILYEKDLALAGHLVPLADSSR